MKHIYHERIKLSLKFSIYANNAWAVMAGFGDSFFSAFAVFLQASPLQMSLIATLPSCIGSLSQLFCHKILRHLKSRRLFVYRNIFAHAIMYAPIASVYFLGEHRVNYLIAFLSIYSIIGMIYQPAWNSWMGDLVDPKERGSFFGKRNNIGVIIQFACFLTAGQILQYSTSELHNKMTGFFIIFSVALIARIISAIFMSMKWEPEYSPEEEHITTLSEISENEEYKNYKRFITFVPLMVFFGSISAPFAVPYILKDLNYSYATYTFIVGGGFLMRILTMPVWGRIADIFGPRKVIATTVFFTVVTQLLWLVSGKVPYLIAIMCVSGFVFAGFEISLNAYLFDSTNSKNRVMGFTYFNVVNGLSGVAGALFGGFLVKHNSLFWSPYLIVFPVAALGRLIVALLFIPRFQEIRKTREASGIRIFSHVFMGMPTTDLILRTFGAISRRKSSLF